MCILGGGTLDATFKYWFWSKCLISTPSKLVPLQASAGSLHQAVPKILNVVALKL